MDEGAPNHDTPTSNGSSIGAGGQASFDIGEELLAQGSILAVGNDTSDFARLNAPGFVGRYVIERLLGAGSFGQVYQALDRELQRRVAIKIPHAHRMRDDSDRQAYLGEARLLASLDHPGVVPVYDFGTIADGRCFVVSKLIEGRTLQQVLADERPTIAQSLPLLISIAETLHHVHQAKLIHRDIKPGNLLVDLQRRVYVADFGLALREADVAALMGVAGTPCYMSPEQAVGEGHRIDGRSDLFSLGIVMYEMLTGTRPFTGGSQRDVALALQYHEPPVPSLIAPDVSSELDRICMKLLAKRASNRYATGQELADDLRHFVDREAGRGSLSATGDSPAVAPTERPSTEAEIVPRGLRAYGRHDAYFFLRLLPGPRNREDLPDSVAHWVGWATDAEDPEHRAVGVIAGPSGCGKSSLVGAGVLPRLPPNVVTIAISATEDRTESQLSAAIDRRFPVATQGVSLAAKLALIRRGESVDKATRLLIVIDQFEQWLHARRDEPSPALTNALRQCDGHRVQCLLLVRDDFWLALNRFMEDLEVPLSVGRNVRLVDLFDLAHARKVLIHFGQAFDRLPKGGAALSAEQERFVTTSIDYLTQDRKVFPVHLALFAEMVKSRDWVPATLEQLGGAVGVGAQFLAESFSGATAPASQKLHENAARAVLESLLPAIGTEIKTQHRSRDELVAISGYERAPRRFAELLQILETDLKLISPVETSDRSRTDSTTESKTGVAPAAEPMFQLSHDFLVPSIRAWLSAELRKTWRGQCRQLVADQAAVWVKQPTPRNLPNWWEWAQCRLLLRAATLTESERQMLAASDRRFGAASVVALVLAGLLLFGFGQFTTWMGTIARVQQLGTTSLATANEVIDHLAPHRRFAEAPIRQAVEKAAPGSNEEFKYRLAELRWDEKAAEPLFTAAFGGDIERVLIARDALAGRDQPFRDRCWKLIESPEGEDATKPREGRETRLKAALMLARFDTTSDAESRWNSHGEALAEQAIDHGLHNPNDFERLCQGMLPVVASLKSHWRKYLGQTKRDDRALAAMNFLAEFERDNPRERTRLALDAAPWQWDFLLPERKQIDAGWLREELARDSQTSSDPMTVVAREQCAAAATALLLSLEPHSSEWRRLARESTPGFRALLIDRLPRLGVSRADVERHLESETDPGVLSGLLLTLGDFADGEFERLSPATRRKVIALHESHDDSGVHAAAEWLLRRCGALPKLPTDKLDATANGKRSWRTTSDGHVLIRFDARHEPQIGRVFEISSHEITVAQFLRHRADKYYSRDHSPTPDCPVTIVKWPEAIDYCDWLSGEQGIPPEQRFGHGAGADPTTWIPQAENYERAGYRLPTSAEWEFACRAGTTGNLFFGNDPAMFDRYVWYGDHPMLSKESPRSFPVGSLRPNDAGLFDMLGNVSEWCADNPSDPQPKLRLVRGGAYRFARGEFSAGEVRSAAADIEFNIMGFRVARTVPPVKSP